MLFAGRTETKKVKQKSARCNGGEDLTRRTKKEMNGELQIGSDNLNLRIVTSHHCTIYSRLD